jgi:ribonuclease HII
MDYFYENNMKNAGFNAVCGIDEAGRGPLAGPVFAAAVILSENAELPGLNDSKKLTPKQREILFDLIINQALTFGIGQASELEIDKINILQATFVAMRRAADMLEPVPQAALVDGNRDPKLGIPALCVVGGDGKSPSIAAASILAKVSRDRFMLELDEQYPQYCFAKHKGYPTELHYRKILEHGISPVHRKTFLKNLSEKAVLYGNHR